MPTVTFEAVSATDTALTVEAPDGGSLGDLCDSVCAPVPFSCRSANCGTCQVEVLEGGEELLPPDEDERDLLDIFGRNPATHRLACCAKMRAGRAVLRLRPAEDDL